MKQWVIRAFLAISLFGGTNANAALIYEFTDSRSSDVLALMTLDTNVGDLTHLNITSFTFTAAGDAIFNLAAFGDFATRFEDTANGVFIDDGTGTLFNPGNALVFIETPFADLGVYGPGQDGLGLFFMIGGGASIQFFTRDNVTPSYIDRSGEWTRVGTVNEPSIAALLLLVLCGLRLRQRS